MPESFKNITQAHTVETHIAACGRDFYVVALHGGGFMACEEKDQPNVACHLTLHETRSFAIEDISKRAIESLRR